MHAATTDARLDAITAKIDDLSRQVDKRIDDLSRQVDKRIDDLSSQVDKRFEQVDKRFERIERRIEHHETRFAQMQLTLMGGFLGVIATLLVAPHL